MPNFPAKLRHINLPNLPNSLKIKNFLKCIKIYNLKLYFILEYFKCFLRTFLKGAITPETPSNFWNNLKVTPLDDTPTEARIGGVCPSGEAVLASPP